MCPLLKIKDNRTAVLYIKNKLKSRKVGTNADGYDTEFDKTS